MCSCTAVRTVKECYVPKYGCEYSEGVRSLKYGSKYSGECDVPRYGSEYSGGVRCTQV